MTVLWSVGKVCEERMLKFMILTSRRTRNAHQLCRRFSGSMVLAPQFHLNPLHHMCSSNVHKRQLSSKCILNPLKVKTVEQFSSRESSREEDHDESHEELFENNKKNEDGQRKWYVSHGYHMVQGKMNHDMEDYVVAKRCNINGKELSLYAIFDGHSGRSVARYLQHHLFDNILSQEDFWEDPKSAVKRAYKDTDEEILDKVAGSRGGSTAVTAILIDNEKLIVANVGDSRGILCKKRNIEQITVDHDPEKEKELVESKGGFVSQKPGGIPRVDGQLAMTRAFGDGTLKQHITSEPNVMIEYLGTDAKFIILASDGLWKVVSNEDVCDCIRELNDAQQAAEELVKEALYKRSLDDISCVVVMFHH